ncbi:MAG: thioredoxin domain-containing protein [Candidatus Moraniibacteriota bacterium]
MNFPKSFKQEDLKTLLKQAEEKLEWQKRRQEFQNSGKEMRQKLSSFWNKGPGRIFAIEMSEREQLKNLKALAIVLLGLFVGSLAVDFVQLTTKSGFSRHVVEDYNVLQSAGKTWVAYPEKPVELQVVTDPDCAECKPDEPLSWLRKIIPTLTVESVDSKSDLGKTLIERLGLKSLPAFVFHDSVTATDFYQQAMPLFHKEAGLYVFDATQVGLIPGKYLVPPEITPDDVVLGSRDAPLKIIVYSDYQCEYCNDFNKVINQVRKEYGDRVAVVYRDLPLSFHTAAPTAAMAALCANEQGAFEKYSDALYTRQREWEASTNTAWFTRLAQTLRLDGKRFVSCLSQNKYADKIQADLQSASEFGLGGAPSTFVGTTLLNGAVDYATLKATIDTALAGK